MSTANAARWTFRGGAVVGAEAGGAAALVGRQRKLGLPGAVAIARVTAARAERARGDLPAAWSAARRAADGLAASAYLVRAGGAQLLAARIAAERGDRDGRERATAAARALFDRAGAHALRRAAEAEVHPVSDERPAEARPLSRDPNAPSPCGRDVLPPSGREGETPLSRREDEVADLVAQGLTNRRSRTGSS